jgi:large subunit ribosomal protein L20
MPRANSAIPRRKKHKKIIKQAKGYFGTRKSNYRTAKDAVQKALQYAYRDRRQKKRDFRRLWIIRINAATRSRGLSYSKFISLLSKNNIEINRKSLAYMAVNDSDGFTKLIDSVNKS